MELDICLKAGLNESQAVTYLHLIDNGPLTPPEIAEDISESRTNVYNILNQLQKFGLVETSPGKKSLFMAKNPSALKQLAVFRAQQAQKTLQEINALLPNIMSKFRLSHDQAGVVHMDGVDAYEDIFDDIFREKSEVTIIRSAQETNDPAILIEIEKQIKRLNKAKINCKIIEPKLFEKYNHNLANNIFVKYSDDKPMPSQLILYGNNLVFNTFVDGVSCTVITDPNIAETHRFIFEFMWNNLK
ncbi:MAG: helix-turn-helix domain-containing protein [Candidatus Saccharibacteria bacterium]